jgi:hypothetical protein
MQAHLCDHNVETQKRTYKEHKERYGVVKEEEEEDKNI